MAQAAVENQPRRYIDGARHRPGMPSPRVRHIDVAICDRERDSRIIYSDYLRYHGFAVETFGSLRDLTRRPIISDLIVLDHTAAVEDAIGRFPNTPTLVLSSWCLQHDQIAAAAAGADGFLAKPCPLNEVLETVIALLRTGPSCRAPGSSTANGRLRGGAIS